MALDSPIAWEDVEDAIQSWVATSTGLETIWRNQSAPQPAHPYASLLLLSGPRHVAGQDEERTSLTNYAKDVKITPVAQDSTTYEVEINETPFQYLSDADATVAEITAGLTSAINLGSEPVTATDNGTDLDVKSDTAVVFTLELSPAAFLTYENNDLGHEIEQQIVGHREITVSVQAYVGTGDVADPDKHAVSLLSRAQTALNVPSYLASLRAGGVAVVDEGDLTDISALEGSTRLGRANLDVRFRLASNVTERVGYIDTVELRSTDLGIDETVPRS